MQGYWCLSANELGRQANTPRKHKAFTQAFALRDQRKYPQLNKGLPLGDWGEGVVRLTCAASFSLHFPYLDHC